MLGRTMLAALAAGLLAAAGWMGQAQAQDYPNKPVRLIVPNPPGGVTDVVGRVFAEALSQSMGQQVVVENRPGAAGNLGSDMVAKSKPDGYTMLVSLIGNAISMSLYKDLPYDFVRDLAPVVQLTSSSNVLVVHPSVPAKTAQELIALAKAKPGSLNYASTGSGTSTHMSGELFKLATGADIVHIPYKGGGPAQIDLLAGQVQMMFDNIPVSVKHIEAGTLRALATTGRTRSKALPDVPTLSESGFPELVIEGWLGISVPAGTPRPIIDRLNAEFTKAFAAPRVKQFYEDTGQTAVGGTPEQFGAWIAAEVEKWRKVVTAANIKVD